MKPSHSRVFDLSIGILPACYDRHGRHSGNQRTELHIARHDRAGHSGVLYLYRWYCSLVRYFVRIGEADLYALHSNTCNYNHCSNNLLHNRSRRSLGWRL